MMASRPFDDDGYIGYDTHLPRLYNSGDDVFVSQPILETPLPPPIGGGSVGFSEFSAEENRNDLDGSASAGGGSVGFSEFSAEENRNDLDGSALAIKM
ncbi:hypothetical protein SLEP1_g6707 [Rubroshorea leprosula]|uniref:Uncharacterized protein n=1 Tax=Rubroshorea leprosula TaxID=152421 RepID=A0AAV5I5X1_9ROSI|nr:hypothetical protein SLEP1_g6707 [Rubroshorea leprosula]